MCSLCFVIHNPPHALNGYLFPHTSPLWNPSKTQGMGSLL